MACHGVTEDVDHRGEHPSDGRVVGVSLAGTRERHLPGATGGESQVVLEPDVYQRVERPIEEQHADRAIEPLRWAALGDPVM
jgi:hypothetical protein